MGGWGGGVATCETEFSTLSHYSIFRTVITTQVPFETEAKSIPNRKIFVLVFNISINDGCDINVSWKFHQFS